MLAAQTPAAKAPQPKAPAAKTAQPKAAAPAPKPAPQPAAPMLQERCMMLSESPGSTNVTITDFPALQLLTLSPAASLPGLTVGGVSAIRCERAIFAIAPEDYRIILEYHLPLIISQGERAAALEVTDGKFKLRMVRGQLQQAEVPLFQSALDENSRAAEAALSRNSPALPPAGQRPG
jgi:hypothetical protein